MLAAGVLLLTMGVTGATARQVAAGQAGSVFDAANTAIAAAPTSTPTAATGTSTAATTNAATGATTTASLKGIPGTPGMVSGTFVPSTSWNPLGKPIANWIVPVLQWASQNGWTGTVTSGYRSFAAQAKINAEGLFSATAGTSNHETTSYPGGAVDVTDPSQLISVLKSYTGADKLIGGVLGTVDPEHFSATGH